MDAATELHNRVAPEALRAIIKPMQEAGADTEEILVVLESVIAGVVAYCTKIGGDNIVVDTLLEGVKERLAGERLGPMMPGGTA